MSFAERLAAVAATDAASLVEAERQYGSSWRRRGGVGAFMMLARKWDRIETALQPRDDAPNLARGSGHGTPVPCWDIITAALADRRDEGILDDIRDLRRYLILVEEFVTREEQTLEAPAPTPAPVDDLQTFPRHVTSAEYALMETTMIRTGTQKGWYACTLYEKSLQGIHPWVMVGDHQQEYSA